MDHMGEGAQEVHGSYGCWRIVRGRRFEDHAKESSRLFKADLLVGHNVAADDRYLKVEFDRLGMKPPHPHLLHHELLHQRRGVEAQGRHRPAQTPSSTN